MRGGGLCENKIFREFKFYSVKEEWLKMKKKMISFFVSCVLIFSSVFPVNAEESVNLQEKTNVEFSDVNKEILRLLKMQIRKLVLNLIQILCRRKI